MNSSLPLAAGLTGVAASFGLNVWLSRLAARKGWCDAATSAVKTHSRPVPFVGGAGVLAGFALGVAVVWAGTQWPGAGNQASGSLAAFVGVGGLGLALGMWDDFRWKTLSVPGRKLALQCAFALAMAGLIARAGLRLGFQSAGVPGFEWPLPALNRLSPHPLEPASMVGWLFAALFILGAMNALNLEDGMDGLCGGEAMLSALGFGFALLLLGRPVLALVAVALAGALAGFVTLNWHPARVFLGDGGSHLVGGLLGTLAIAMLKGQGLGAIPGALLLIGLPVVDTGWVMVRRLARGEALGRGDREHLYDRLHDAGLSVGATVATCWLVQAALVTTGVFWLSRFGV